MRKIRHWLNSIKLRHKLALFYVCFCFLPVMILFLFSFIQMRGIIEDKENINLESYLYQSVAAMDGKLKVYGNLSDYIAFDKGLLEVFSKRYDSPYEQYEQVTQKVDPVIQSLKYFHDDIERITIYTDNGMIKHDTTIAPVSEIADEGWYQETQLASGLIWHVNRREQKMFCAHRMPAAAKDQRSAVLCIEVDYGELFAPYEQTLNSEYGIFITDKIGEVLYEGSRFSEENSSYVLSYQQFIAQQGKGEESPYKMISQVSEVTGWKIWLYQPDDVAGGAMRPVSVMVILTAVLCLAGAVAANYVISHLVSSRVERLTRHMLSVEQGNLEAEQEKLTEAAESQDGDEIGILYRSFAKMLQRIRTLIQEVYVGRINQKEAEMRALQAQINPHFLYNTLSLINWKAIAAGEEDISKMTLAMSVFYRTALNRGRNTLRVEDELKNTRAYLEIQSMMHDGGFDYVIDAQEDILECQSLNLILQPLVENAIMHGIETKTDGRGRIDIIGRLKDGCVFFTVRDNGVGMEEEVAQRILTMESKGYGVRNVNERICLFYGEEYALRVSSAPGEGTEILVHFPAECQKKETGYRDSQKNDINHK